MPIETDSDGTDDNEGPHCRNCHVGASNCDVCHDATSGNTASYTSTITAKVLDLTSYSPQSFLRQSAVANVNSKCLDGGFSFPHRTLGANMLKDELYGIDFNGDPKPFGTSRTTNGGTAPSQTATFSVMTTGFAMWTGETMNGNSIIPAVSGDTTRLENAAVENLDTVCIDCHGDGTYWNGDGVEDNTNPFYTQSSFTSSGADTYGWGGQAGWELLLKGLP